MKKKKIIHIMLPAFICVLLIISGCGNTTGSNTSSGDSVPQIQDADSAATESSSGDNDQLSIMLDWYPNAVHSFIYVAQEKGYFADQGLDVDIQMPADTNDALKLVAAGKVDLALSYQPQILLARGRRYSCTIHCRCGSASTRSFADRNGRERELAQRS